MCHAHAIHIVRPEVRKHRAKSSNRFEIYTVIQTTSYSGVPKSSLQTTIAEAMVCIKVSQVILTTIAEDVVCKCAN